MTTKTLDWLNANRFRSYPFKNDEGLVCNGSTIPNCVLLDCLVMDTRIGIPASNLVFSKIKVEETATTVYFSYTGIESSYRIEKGAASRAEDAILTVSGVLPSGFPEQFVHLSFSFSTHDYILERVGLGEWSFTGTVLPSKVVQVNASGVSGIKTNGSSGVQAAGTAVGDVHLVDGYRTQPVIQHGKVIVKVGTDYGYDPCRHSDDESSSDSPEENVCDNLLFFFCGQNAINNGNVVMQGGPGVQVKQGGSYEAKEDILDSYGNVGIQKGEKIPCIEIIAASELLNIYRPSSDESSGSGQ